jgi:hypothetical protein
MNIERMLDDQLDAQIAALEAKQQALTATLLDNEATLARLRVLSRMRSAGSAQSVAATMQTGMAVPTNITT